MTTELIDAPPLHIDEIVGGSRVFSYALRDAGVDVLFDLPDREVTYRVLLGDMRFVARLGRGGQPARLYFAPEFPNTELGVYDRITTYYAVLLDGGKLARCELEVSDSNLRLLSWDEGLALARVVPQVDEELGAVLKRLIDIDAMVRLHRPNVSSDEMRRTIGRATGARVLMSASLMGALAD